jgi:hypothetical protein
MNRKDFLLCAGSLMATGRTSATAAGADAAADCEKKQEFTRNWLKRFMAAMDKELDEPTRTRLMEASGRACFRSSPLAGLGSVKPGGLDKFLAGFRQKVGEDAARREGNTVY